jgi:hypothetical protein
VATAALHGAEPSPELVGMLRFNIFEERDGYMVQVWQVVPGKVNPTGNFTAVQVDREFTVVRIHGGA